MLNSTQKKVTEAYIEKKMESLWKKNNGGNRVDVKLVSNKKD